MLLLVGLGNPGGTYAGNRHNIGFMAVDEIVRRHNFSAERTKFQSLVSEGKLAGEKILVIKPQTFMNESGRAVSEAMRFYKLTPDDVVVIYDELDLATGKIRIKKGGGAAGHNGIRSITNHIGADFHRVRLGIGHPGDKGLVHSHVLSDFGKRDQAWLEPFLDEIGRAADWIATDLTRFQAAVASALSPARPSTGQKNETSTGTQKVSVDRKTYIEKTEDGSLADKLKGFFSPKKDT